MTRALLVPGKWYYFRKTNLQIIRDKYGSEIQKKIISMLAFENDIDNWFRFKVIDLRGGRQIIKINAHNSLNSPNTMRKRMEKELKELREEYNSTRSPKPQFLIDNDDEYQDNLELGWYRDELRGRIKQLEEEIKSL